MLSKLSEQLRHREVRLDLPKIKPTMLARGFTIVELLVTISIVALLVSIMMPGLRAARESAYRIQCSSNLRQIGLAMYGYALQSGERLPATLFDDDETLAPTELMALTTGTMSPIGDINPSMQWDGLGLLISEGSLFLDNPRVLYCPCHHGNHHFAEMTEVISKDSPTRIYCNYHFIGDTEQSIPSLTGEHTNSPRHLYAMSEMAIVVDGMRESSDINHRTGTNILRGDLSVRFWHDNKNLLNNTLISSSVDQPPSEQSYRELWADFSK